MSSFPYNLFHGPSNHTSNRISGKRKLIFIDLMKQKLSARQNLNCSTTQATASHTIATAIYAESENALITQRKRHRAVSK